MKITLKSITIDFKDIHEIIPPSGPDGYFVFIQLPDGLEIRIDKRLIAEAAISTLATISRDGAIELVKG